MLKNISLEMKLYNTSHTLLKEKKYWKFSSTNGMGRQVVKTSNFDAKGLSNFFLFLQYDLSNNTLQKLYKSLISKWEKQ